jgi:chaperonin GroEL
VIVTADSTTFIEGGGSEADVEARLAEIRAELARASDYRDVEVLEERLARLSSSLAVIRVGAPADVVRTERLRRTEGALAATQAAVSEGIVAGGGTALLRSAQALDALSADGEYGRGVDVVRSVLSEPLYWIASNAGYDGQATIDQVKAMPEGHGLDAVSGDFGDLFEKGVIDPVRVTRLSLEHAASVAALMLTTEALVAEELIAQPGAIIAPGFGDLAEGLARPSSPI